MVYSQLRNAEVAEPADALDSKSSGLNTRVGSTPTFCTALRPEHTALSCSFGFFAFLIKSIE